MCVWVKHGMSFEMWGAIFCWEGLVVSQLYSSLSIGMFLFKLFQLMKTHRLSVHRFQSKVPIDGHPNESPRTRIRDYHGHRRTHATITRVLG